VDAEDVPLSTDNYIKDHVTSELDQFVLTPTEIPQDAPDVTLSKVSSVKEHIKIVPELPSDNVTSIPIIPPLSSVLNSGLELDHFTRFVLEKALQQKLSTLTF